MDNKTLVDRLAKNLKRTKKDVNNLLGAITAVLTERLGETDVVAVPGFGNFESRKRNERVVVIPSSGRRMLVPPKIVVSFKVSNVLKTKIK